VSLNRCEETLLRYVRAHPDELRFWTARVLEIDRRGGTPIERVHALEGEMRAYAGERARADRDIAEAFGPSRVSLRNLAEHLLATWTPPRPARKAKPGS
jgi:hypothetical protein